MAEKGFRKLRIDEEFKTLIRPLRKEEYAMLEANIALDGCRESIITWNGTIIDGHNRYEICNRLEIPYSVLEKEFDSREEVVIWICTNQLGRRNITEETRKYLIGRQYEAEKAVGFNRNHHGFNQYHCDDNSAAEVPESKESGRRTANRIGEKYHVSSGAVQKYAKYSKALDEIAKKDPEFVPQILSGNYKISHDNVVALSEMDAEEVKRMHKKQGPSATPFIRYSESRRDFSPEPDTNQPHEVPAIKTMPSPDPDAEAAGLALTIPSWTSSIERTKKVSDWNLVSKLAKDRLEDSLVKLHHEVLDLIRVIKGG